MIPIAPPIGFDQFIQQDWVAAALMLCPGVASPDDLNALPGESHRIGDPAMCRSCRQGCIYTEALIPSCLTIRLTHHSMVQHPFTGCCSLPF